MNRQGPRPELGCPSRQEAPCKSRCSPQRCLPQASCTISKLTRSGKVFTITDKCADIRGGGEIVGIPIVVTIASPTGFTKNKETYRYCGPKVQF